MCGNRALILTMASRSPSLPPLQKHLNSLSRSTVQQSNATEWAPLGIARGQSAVVLPCRGVAGSLIGVSMDLFCEEGPHEADAGLSSEVRASQAAMFNTGEAGHSWTTLAFPCNLCPHLSLLRVPAFNRHYGWLDLRNSAANISDSSTGFSHAILLGQTEGHLKMSLFNCDYEAGVLAAAKCVTFTYKTVSSGEIRHAKRQ